MSADTDEFDIYDDWNDEDLKAIESQINIHIGDLVEASQVSRTASNDNSQRQEARELTRQLLAAMEDNRRLKDELSYTISSAEKRIYEVGLKHSREIESLNTKILFMEDDLRCAKLRYNIAADSRASNRRSPRDNIDVLGDKPVLVKFLAGVGHTRGQYPGHARNSLELLRNELERSEEPEYHGLLAELQDSISNLLVSCDDDALMEKVAGDLYNIISTSFVRPPANFRVLAKTIRALKTLLEFFQPHQLPKLLDFDNNMVSFVFSRVLLALAENSAEDEYLGEMQEISENIFPICFLAFYVNEKSSLRQLVAQRDIRRIVEITHANKPLVSNFIWLCTLSLHAEEDSEFLKILSKPCTDSDMGSESVLGMICSLLSEEPSDSSMHWDLKLAIAYLLLSIHAQYGPNECLVTPVAVRAMIIYVCSEYAYLNSSRCSSNLRAEILAEFVMLLKQILPLSDAESHFGSIGSVLRTRLLYTMLRLSTSEGALAELCRDILEFLGKPVHAVQYSQPIQ